MENLKYIKMWRKCSR